MENSLGYIQDEIKKDHYLCGTLRLDILQKDRDWRPFLPAAERQNIGGFETSNCTGFGTNNAIETLIRRKFRTRANFSDRYLGICSGTSQAYGNSPHTVIETMRCFTGAIPESDLPFSPEHYYSGVTFAHKIAGAKWLMEYEIEHEWALDGTEPNWQDALFDALQFSPIGIAVPSWVKDGLLYVRSGEDMHWTLLVGAKKGECWIVADSYDPFVKRLAWDFGFTRAKTYAVKKREDFSLQFYQRVGRGVMGLY